MNPTTHYEGSLCETRILIGMLLMSLLLLAEPCSSTAAAAPKPCQPSMTSISQCITGNDSSQAAEAKLVPEQGSSYTTSAAVQPHGHLHLCIHRLMHCRQ